MPKYIELKTSKEELEELYINQNMSFKDLCTYFKVGHTKMSSILKKYNVIKPPKLSVVHRENTMIQKHGYKTYMESENYYRTDITKELLDDLYITRNFSKKQVAEYLKCGETLVTVRLKEYGIKKPKELKNSLREHTNMERYGVRFNSQTQIWKDKIPEIARKSIETRIKNGTVRTSKPEDILYNLIKIKYPDVIRQYTNKKLKLHVDFYIPSIDTYIEYQGHWRHGNHPFDPNNLKDIEILKKWKRKNTKYYNGCIRCWTVIDPLKREIASRNNLRYKEIWKTDLDRILSKRKEEK